MKRWPLLIALAVVVVAASYYVWTAYLRRPSLSAKKVEWVEIALHDQVGNKTQGAISKNREKITALVEVLRRGVPTSDHKCGDSGSITLEPFGYGITKLGILAGHHEPYYEFRLYTNDGRGYEMYRVERPAFLEALADLGITKVDLGGPE